MVSDVINVLTRTQRKSKKHKFPSITAKYPRYNYEIDIMDYNRYAYNGYRYILTCIDVYSRFVMGMPLRTRAMSEVIPALSQIFQIMGPPKYVNADQEFNTHAARNFFLQQGVKHIFFSQPYEKIHNAVVERFHRTLAGLLLKYRLINNDPDWVSALPKVLEIYDTKIHSTIKARPVDVFLGIDENHQDIIYPEPPKFRVGDYVVGPRTFPGYREPTFRKSDTINKRLYYVREIKGQKIYVRTLDGQEVPGYYKPYQLRKIPLKDVPKLLVSLYAR